ncbi:hypothetical protein Emed_001326 [Eimeria media]
MFADAADSGLDSVPGGSVEPSARLGLSGVSVEKEAQEEHGWLSSSLEQLETVHLLPCHIKYSGQASVSELFRPSCVQSDAATQADAGKLQVLLHGRWLRGQEQRLTNDEEALQLRGFVVAAAETSCMRAELRKALSSAQMNKSETPEVVCEDLEGSPATVTALRPCAEFNKLCYWQQDREPSATDDVQQSLFFLKAMAAVSSRGLRVSQLLSVLP